MTLAFTFRHAGRSIRLPSLVFVLVAVMAKSGSGQVQHKDTAPIRARNADAVATAMGGAVATYVDNRNSRHGLAMGARLCGAKLNAPALPIDQRAFDGMARAVGVGRRVTCDDLAGSRSAAAGVIRVDSVSLTLSTATVYATVTRATTSQHERAFLELVGWGTSRHWTVVRIDSLGAGHR